MSGIKPNGAIEDWNSHAIAIVTNTGNDTREYLPRGQAASRDILHVQRCHAECVSRGDGPCGEPCTDDVANTSTDTGRGPAIWLERRRMVMGFYFEAHRVVIVETNNACIVNEDRQAPVRETLVHEPMGRSRDGRLQ